VRLRAALAALAALACLAAASDPGERMADPAQESRARAIFRDVRCLVCQNESIDDSEAELAADLRKIVREQVAAGRSDPEIKGFLTERYGEFVLMTPRFSAGNLALWAGPFAVLLFGAGLLLVRLRRPRPEPELTPEEAERLKRLADGHE
jgi:cytochrome c-type biogenesis protein CcmH